MLMGVVLNLLALQVLRISAQGSENNCLSNDNCSSDRVCVSNKCIDPCLAGICGRNTQCLVQNHIPMCACQSDYVGHPFTGCIAAPPGSTNCGGTSTFDGATSRSKRKEFHLHHDSRKTWLRAVAHCMSLNMSLATISNEAENNQLAEQIKKISLKLPGRWWIGGSDLTGNFMWTSTGKRINYDQYHGGQPDNFMYENKEVEHCLEFRPDWGNKWNDFLCDYRQYFVCENNV